MIHLSPLWGFGLWDCYFLYTFRPAGAMLVIIRNVSLMQRMPPKRDSPVAPLGLWVVGFLFSIHLSPRWGFEEWRQFDVEI